MKETKTFYTISKLHSRHSAYRKDDVKIDMYG